MTVFSTYDMIDLVLQVVAMIQLSTLLDLNSLILRKKLSALELVSEFFQTIR